MHAKQDNQLVLWNPNLLLRIVVVPANLLELQFTQNPAGAKLFLKLLDIIEFILYSCCMYDILAENDVEQLQADGAVGSHFIGQRNLQCHGSVLPLECRHYLCHVVRETVRKVENHAIEGTHSSDERLVLLD